MLKSDVAQPQRLRGARAVAVAKHNVKTISMNFVSLVSIEAIITGWHKMSLFLHIVSVLVVFWSLVVAGASLVPFLQSFRLWRQAASGAEIEIVELPHPAVLKTPWLFDTIVVTLLSALVLPFLVFPLFVIAGAYPVWGKVLAGTLMLLMSCLLVIAWQKLLDERKVQQLSNEQPWKMKAISLIPSLDAEIRNEQNPVELWITLSYFFEQAYELEHRNDRLIRDIYAFAEWSLLSSGGELPEDEAKGLKDGAVSFYESASRSPLAGPDCINHITQSVRADLSHEAATI